MTHILKVDPGELIKRTAAALKKEKLVEPASWSPFVKTGVQKQRLPEDADWWYVRAAAVLRSVARLGPIGTQKLRTKYGGKKRRGYKPAEFRKSSGSIARKILQQLEKAAFIKQVPKGVHKGRVLTPKGTSFMDKIAIQVAKEAKKNE